MRTLWSLLLLVVLPACAAGSARVPAAGSGVEQAASLQRASGSQIVPQASIWFHPMPPEASGGPPPGDLGSADYLELFSDGAAWPEAAARTSVFGLYAGWIPQASDPVLRETVAFLNAHRMGIELEAPAMQALATCGTGVEGYVPYGQSLHDFTLTFLRRLKAFGGRLLFVKADEPFFFGSVTTDARSCHFTVEQVAQQFQSFAQLVKSVYPEAQVGDVEPVIAQAYSPDPVTAIDRWHDTYRELTGEPLPFFIADMDFSNPAWPSLAKALEDATHARGMRSGIIYSGDPHDASDTEWSGKAVARFQAYQGANRGRPDYVLFQSWMEHPKHCLPESDPTTFTGVLDAYTAEFVRSPIIPDSTKS